MGERVGHRPQPPPPPPRLEKLIKMFCYIGGLFATFSSHVGLFATFFSAVGDPFTIWGLFAIFYSMAGAFFWACPPPTKIFAGANGRGQGGLAHPP